jgi:hypothetical protein
MPKHLTLVQSLSICPRILRMFIVRTSSAWRARSVVRPDGSPIKTVPAPSYAMSTRRFEFRVGDGAHQCDGGIAGQVHPKQRHEREEVSDMHRGRGWVYTDVCSNWLLRKEPIELLSASKQPVSSCSVAESRMAYPATSFTKPRSSKVASMLFSSPFLTLCARCSHCAASSSGTMVFFAQVPFCRRPSIAGGCRRMHCWQT